MMGPREANRYPYFVQNLPEPAAETADPDEFLSHLYLPAGGNVFFTGDAGPANADWLRKRHGAGIRIVACSPRTILAAIERRYRDVFRHRSVTDLAESEPQFSASTVITRGQIFAFAMIAVLVSTMLFFAPGISDIALTVIFGGLFVANVGFRGLLLWVGADERPVAQAALLPSGDALPIYSILVPLYREANVVPSLARSLCALDYPKDRLDIKLIVEADDGETGAAADLVASDSRFSVIRVPPGTPRTKPRACNYAMPFVLGEFTVIFDAEDRPEPDQLRKAVATFRAAPGNIACLQARLNFYNANENWLTRMFALDYALWFDYLLPGLDRLNIPMPLGGTSNHFRTTALRAIHGWDPYNVTEDADIGIRLARLGLRVHTLDSTTFEEATNGFGNWLRQRSRWLKGYMQTWLVHMRSPIALLRHAGLGGFIGFQLFVGGTFLSALVNPLLWAIFLLSNLFGISVFAVPAAGVVSHVSIASLVAGNGMFVYLAMLAPLRRDWLELTPYGLTAPLYWLLISCAGLRAFCQLFTRPWHWEKTAHGLSKHGAP
jgi:cellulose synthase/poly-beta-1,6-N-acetylglucosamine synthase-like glycosyltransferase